MTHPGPALHILTGPAVQALTGERQGKFAPVLVPQAGPVAFTRLDTFDQSLRRTNRLLLDLGPALDLILPDGSTLTQPLPQKARFAADLPEGPVKRALADLSRLRSLLPLGSGKFSRFCLAFVDDDQKIHCRAALQTLTMAEGQTLTLLTPHGLRGYDKALADLRHHVEACGTPFHMATFYALLFPCPPETGSKATVTPNQTAFDAATAIIARQIPLAIKVEPGIIADHDTEFLHDGRVALRRIRSVLSLFRGVYQPDQTASLKARFAALMAQTGPLRDMDVHLLERQSCYDLLPASLHPGLDAMFALHRVERAKAQARLSRHLRSIAHVAEMADLARLFTTPQALYPGPMACHAAFEFGAALIWKRYRKMRQIAVSIGPETADPAVHALRIQCKKLRYMVQFCAALYPVAEVKFLLKPLKTVQDHLGLVNDLSVQQTALQTFLKGSDGSSNATRLQVAQTVGTLTTVLHQRKLEERQKTTDILSALIAPAVQKTFRDLFHRKSPNP